MRRAYLSLFLALTSVFACAPLEIESVEWAIVNGERTNMNEPAVVAVLNFAGGLCTGTLISPRVVLTAKHCVQASGAAGPYDATNFIVGVGDSVNRLSQRYDVQEVWTPPGSYRSDGRLTGLVGQDVALLTLRRPSSITPIPIYRENPRTQLNEPVRVVGFGQIPSGGAGVKYRVMSRITSLMGGVIGTPPATCQGDSGGPLITASEQVVGVTSFGSGGCGASSVFNGYNRIDIFLEDIDRVLRESGECVPTPEVCNGTDDNCDGTVDEGCSGLGETCNANDECSSQRCESVGGQMRCVSDCDALRPYTCETGFYCERTDGCSGRCIRGEAGILPDGAACERDTECASLRCEDILGERVCRTPCRSGDGFCYEGEICAAPPGTCGGCYPAGVFAEPAAVGESCETNEDCGTANCFREREDLTQGYCTTDCTSDETCGANLHCRLSDDGTGTCIRGPRSGVGGRCDENGDCSAGLFCADRGDFAWCSQLCESEADCPSGFTCLDVGGTPICAPVAEPVGSTCSASEDCLSGACEAGVCVRSCGPEAPCETGLVCERTETGGTCVAAASSEAASRGGGCSATSPSTLSAWLLLVPLFLWRRRTQVPSDRASCKTLT